MDHIAAINSFMTMCQQWTRDKYEDQMILNADAAPKLPRRVIGRDLIGRELTDHIMAWFMLGWTNPETGITPAQEFAKYHIVGQGWEDAVKYMGWIMFGEFRVLNIRKDRTGRVRSPATGKIYHVVFRVGRELQKNDVFVGCMHRWYENLYVTTGTVVVVESDVSAMWVPSCTSRHPGGALPAVRSKVRYISRHAESFTMQEDTNIAARWEALGKAGIRMRRAMDKQQERYESVRINELTDLRAYLNSQLGEHVKKVAGSLNIHENAKWRNIERIREELVGSGIVRAMQSLSARHMECLEAAAAGGGVVKRHLAERRIGGETEIPRELYEQGLLMLGTKITGGRRYKAVGIPADVLDNMMERELLEPRYT